MDDIDIRHDMPPPRKGMSGRLLFALVGIAFIGGLVIMGWAMTHWRGSIPFVGASANEAALESGGQDVPAAGQQTPVITRTYGALGQGGQLAHIAELEQRLTRIQVAAQAAGAYAFRSEAMMIAFAARRALDAGRPLDHIEPQLRVIFGQAQPRAVATIVNAAAQPVTIPVLRIGLEDMAIAVTSGDPNAGWWRTMTRELGNLFVVRRIGSPSSAPTQRLARAKLDVESGQIDAAIAEMEPFQRQPKVATWLEKARRYNEAQRALDVIEAAATLQARGQMVTPVPPPVLQSKQTQ